MQSGNLGSPAVFSGNLGSGQVGLFHLQSGLQLSGLVLSGGLGSGQVGISHLQSGLQSSGIVLSGGIGSGQVGISHLQSGLQSSGLLLSGGLGSGQVGVYHLQSGLQTSGMVNSGGIGSGQLGFGHLANGSVQSGTIASGSIAIWHLVSGLQVSGIVNSGGIASGQIGFGHLADAGVRSGTIASGQIAILHLVSGLQISGIVNSGGIGSGQVGFGHLADASVQSGTLASGILGVFNFSSGMVVSDFNNQLINGGMWMCQRQSPTSGIAIASGTSGGDVYSADRFKVAVSSGSSMVYLRWDRLTSGWASGVDNRFYGSWQNGQSGGRYAVYQPIESAISQSLANCKVNYQFRAKSPTSGLIFQMGILQTNSGVTSDTIPNSIISGWSANSGTSPTFGSGMALVSPSSIVQLQSIWNTYNLSTTAYSGHVCLIPSLWSNDPQASGAILHMTEVGLYVDTGIVKPWRPRSRAQEMLLCHRYRCQSFTFDVGPAQFTGDTTGTLVQNATSASFTTNFVYPACMRTTPTVTTYNPSSASGARTTDWRNFANTLDGNAVVTRIGTRQLSVGTNSGTVGQNFMVHISAEADL